MFRHVVAFSIAAVFLSSSALAETLISQPSQDFSGEYGQAIDMAQFVKMDVPDEVNGAFLTEVSFLAKTYGDVSGLYGSVVVYQPGEDEFSFPGIGETADELMEIMDSQVFNLSDVSTSGGWFTIEFDPFPVSTELKFAVYAYSNDARGLEIGLSNPVGEQSGSGWLVTVKERNEEERVITTTQTSQYRGDGREWMFRATFTDTVDSGFAVDPKTLSGPGFKVYDDGGAEGFVTTQRYGPMLYVKGDAQQVLDSVYIFGKLEGDWFESEHKGGLYVMDKDFRLVTTARIPFSLFTNNEAWTEIKMGTGVKVPAEFYLLIEPNSRPAVQLMIGYDASGPNLASTFGTAGSVLDWETEAPEESTNWMVRLHFK